MLINESLVSSFINHWNCFAGNFYGRLIICNVFSTLPLDIPSRRPISRFEIFNVFISTACHLISSDTAFFPSSILFFCNICIEYIATSFQDTLFSVLGFFCSDYVTLRKLTLAKVKLGKLTLICFL
jgi:hypothetical protein